MTARDRVQLTLFAPREATVSLKAIRRILDPVQASLIAAHVALCREDEVGELSPALARSRLAAAQAAPLTLRFGAPEQFSTHGILLACVEGEQDFHALRRNMLGTTTLRQQSPHLTLAHPRNPRAPGNNLTNAAALASGLCLTFATICRIREEGAGPWRVVEEYPLEGVEGDAVPECDGSASVE